MAVEIGALRALLSLDSAAFERGASRAQASMGNLQRRFARVGGTLRDVGQRLSVGLTTPLTGAAAASMAAGSALAELDNQAKVAGISAQELKTLSLATQGVGIDSEKLADILKDVNDKLGDYKVAGAGGAVDFFEQIAPKVGLTIEAFEGLSSSDALQLYISALEEANVSQAEMTFYLEALASDATALLPVFANGGAMIDDFRARAEKLGLAISDKTITAAREAGAEFRVVSEVLKTRMQAALVDLLPAFTKLGETMVPVFETAVNWTVRISEAFGNLSPRMQRIIATGVALAAVAGPLAVGLGALASVFAILAGPVGLVVVGLTAVAGAAAYVYTQWDTIKAKYPALAAALEGVAAVASEGWERFKNAGAAAVEVFEGYASAVSAALDGDFTAALDGLKAAGQSTQDFWFALFPELETALAATREKVAAAAAYFRAGFGADLRSGIETARGAMSDLMSGILSRLEERYPELTARGAALVGNIAGGISAGASVVWDRIRQLGTDLAEKVKELAGDVIAAGKELGIEIINGVVAGVREKIEEARAAIRGAMASITGAAKDEAEIRSPSRVFARIGHELMRGAAVGIEARKGDPVEAARAAGEDVTEAMKKATEAGAEPAANGLVSTFSDAFDRIVFQGESFSSVMLQLFQNLGNQLRSAGLNQLFGAIWSGISGGGSGSAVADLAKVAMAVPAREIAAAASFNPMAGGLAMQSPALAGVKGRAGGAGLGGGSLTLNVNVTGARGNKEVSDMVEQGVRAGLAQYDAQMPDRVAQIQRDPRVR